MIVILHLQQSWRRQKSQVWWAETLQKRCKVWVSMQINHSEVQEVVATVSVRQAPSVTLLRAAAVLSHKHGPAVNPCPWSQQLLAHPGGIKEVFLVSLARPKPFCVCFFFLFFFTPRSCNARVCLWDFTGFRTDVISWGIFWKHKRRKTIEKVVGYCFMLLSVKGSWLCANLDSFV